MTNCLEAIAWRNPAKTAEVAEVSELKGWQVREFGREIAEALREADDEAE